MLINKQNIPNYLTILRLLCVPAALVVMFTTPVLHPALFWIVLAAFVSDFFDGYLARSWNAVTPLGTLLDPIADKLLVALLLLYLLAVSGNGASLSLYMNPLFIPVTVILLRELYISGLREFLAARGKTLPVSRGGKLKTATQMLGILLMLSPPILRDFTPLTIGLAVLWLAALIAFVSAAFYTRASMKLAALRS